MREMRIANRFYSTITDFQLLPSETKQILGLLARGGFRLKNGKEYFEGLAYINNQPYLWNILSPITRDAFLAATIIRPLPDIVVVGTGRWPVALSPALRHMFEGLGISHEVHQSVNTFPALFVSV